MHTTKLIKVKKSSKKLHYFEKYVIMILTSAKSAEKERKTNMKTALRIILAIALIAAIIGGALVIREMNEGLHYDIDSVEKIESNVEIVSENEDSVTIRKNDDSDFKVVMFTDAHLNGNINDRFTLKYLVENITREKPDLVIFGGDNVSSALSKKRTDQFTKLMENLGVYWAAVLGNHDGEGVLKYSRKKVIDVYSSAENSLVRQGKEDIDGNGNFTINILNSDGSLREVFFLIDSGDYMSNEMKEKYGVDKNDDRYDGVKESQVQWYKEKHDELTEEYGEFKSITVMHIPPYQSGETEEWERVYGTRNEGICEAGFDSGLFDALKEKGSCQAVYFGHDHVNDFGVMYDGILLSYIQSSGYSSYNMGSRGEPESNWLQGCTILNIKSDGTYDAARHLNHAE